MKNVQIVLTVLCGLTLVPAYLDPTHTMAYLSVAFGSYFALKSAWGAVQERSVDVNLLMVLAAAGAIYVGHPEDAAALLFLFSLSSTLEMLAMAKTRSAIESLVRLRPDQAILVTDEGDKEVPTDHLKFGDTVRVLPFQQIPADGTLFGGQAQIDESAMTGESRPVDRLTGDRLLAGTQNLDSMLMMTVTAEVGDSTLEKIVELVRDAQENKASGERISQWFGQRYTFFVLFAFVAMYLIRTLFGDASALYNALILLVALSPCALVISTPATTLSALAYAARRGILVRGGQFIEAAGHVDFVALDKTGTLTEGAPYLVEICIGPAREGVLEMATVIDGHDCGGAECVACTCISCWHRGQPQSDAFSSVLALAAAAERFSTHPIAEAIVAAATEMRIEIPEATQHTAYAGFGISAEVDDRNVKIGQVRFFEAGELPGGFREHIEEMQSRGLTSILMQWDGGWACFGMSDKPREIAAALVNELHKENARVVMLTGDNMKTAQATAASVGLDEIYAGMMPQDKAVKIEEWVQEGCGVMMIGDGINDAPALAKAHIGVAMGGLGSDVALKAADVVLVQDRIDRIPELIRLGRKTNQIIRANLIFASATIITLTLLSALWRSIPWLVQFNANMPLPMAVVGHEGSTVLVILNGLRLLRGPGTKTSQSATR